MERGLASLLGARDNNETGVNPGRGLTFLPWWRSARANSVEMVLFPTPPFPERTRMICRTPARFPGSGEKQSELGCLREREREKDKGTSGRSSRSPRSVSVSLLSEVEQLKARAHVNAHLLYIFKLPANFNRHRGNDRAVYHS